MGSSRKTIIITGGSNGIGAAAAKLLKEQGAEVVIVGRSARTASVASALGCHYYLADFTKLDDVRKLAGHLRQDFPRIDVLVNNAGGVMGERRVTVDGNESTFQVNYLAGFLLTNLLLDVLIASKGAVIQTSSVAHARGGALDLTNLDLEHGYTPEDAYGKAKLMDILFTTELHKRYHSRGLSAAAFHPGIVRTAFASEFDSRWSLIYHSLVKYFLLSPGRGADTMVWLASNQAGEKWESGKYYEHRKIKVPSVQAQNSQLAHDLWELSQKRVGDGGNAQP